MENNLELQDILRQLDEQKKINTSLTDIVQKLLSEKKGDIEPKLGLDEDLSKLTQQHVSSLGHEPSFIMFDKDEENHPQMKSMIATSLNDRTSNFSFKKKNNFNWNNLTHKISLLITPPLEHLSEKGKVLYQKHKISLKEKANLWKAQIHESIKDNIENITLIGDKRIIKKLNKSFKNNLALLGFDVQEVISGKKNNAIGTDKVQENIEQLLQNKINIHANDGEYDITLLNELDSKMKLEMIKKIIWPSLAKELTSNMELTLYLSQLANNDKALKDLFKFSKKNNIHADIVIHSLKKNPDILKNYSDSNKIFENKEQILFSENKYSTLTENNLVVLNSLIKVTEKIKSILSDLPENLNAKEFIEQIDNYEVARKNGAETVVYKYEVISNNMRKIKNESQNVDIKAQIPSI